MYALRPREFFEIKSPQVVRLKETCGADHIVILEDEFCSFKRYVAGSASAQQELRKYDSCIVSRGGVFPKAWAPFYQRFSNLVSFLGGLATVFTGPASVESEFSTLQFEKDDYCSNMSNISLEGIMQSKLAKYLSRLSH